MKREIMAAARELARTIEEAKDSGEGFTGRETMRFGANDILEAIGLSRRGAMDWITPAAIGLGVGAVLGAAVALMVTPRTGMELREELRQRGRRVVERGRDVVSERTPS